MPIKDLSSLLVMSKNLAKKTRAVPNVSGTTARLNELLNQEIVSKVIRDKVEQQVIPRAQIKRTGVLAGRSFVINQHNNLANALRQLNTVNNANKIKRVLGLQKWHERPGKTKLRIRNEKARRDFNMGIRRLFDLVAEARRKGY